MNTESGKSTSSKYTTANSNESVTQAEFNGPSTSSNVTSDTVRRSSRVRRKPARLIESIQ